jgi:hypothetical protein
MNTRIFGTIISGLLLLCGIASGQRSIERYKGPIKPMVCYGTNINANISIPAPESTLRHLKSGSTKKTQFIVTYHNFPENAKAAFQYALDIWSTILYTSVPVRVNATWDSSLPSGVLGSTSPSNFYRKLEGAYQYDVYYPIVLAEKILGFELGGELQPDIDISIGSSIPWYLGTDAKPGFNQYDLTTVTLHEICHGLGFTGSFFADITPTGSFGVGPNSNAEIFDYFVKNASGQQLIDTNIFKNPSTTLGFALTALNKVFFDGIMTEKANGSRVTLYSPFPWTQGSSIYHVADKYYQTPNTLMYYAIDKQEAVHNPGAMLTGMMNDMGWIHTWIHHDTLPDIETISGPRIITATIQSDTTITPGSLYLFTSFNNFLTHDSAQMQPTGNPNEYSAGINIPGLGTTVSYYLTVKDIFNRLYAIPGGVPANHFTFFAGKDTIPPTIQHQPAQFLLNITDSLKVSAVVTDNLGVDTVYIEYKHNNDSSVFSGMKKDSLSAYSGYLYFSSFNLNPGDSIAYRIIAIDKSASKNIAYSPATGFYVIPVVNVPTPFTSYYTTFDSINHDFLFSGFNISTPSGFNSPCLNSDHPYASPQIDNSHFDYMAQLRIPVILNDTNAFIFFDEVALVEPGDSGSTFGSSNFYDYVIVEGSKDGGNSWNYFIPGWSSNDNPSWLARFNSKLDRNNNSLASGDANLFRKRRLDMRTGGNFKGGDTILIRFRLYSDPYVHGWGWAIDNLNIQDFLLGISSMKINESVIQLYPNPASSEVKIQINLPQAPNVIRLQLIDALGQTMKETTFKNPGNAMNETISLEGLQKGIYLAVIWIDGARTVRKVSILR